MRDILGKTGVWRNLAAFVLALPVGKLAAITENSGKNRGQLIVRSIIFRLGEKGCFHAVLSRVLRCALVCTSPAMSSGCVWH